MRDSVYQLDEPDELPSSSQFADWLIICALEDEIGELEAELVGVKEDRDAWEEEARGERIVVERRTVDVMKRVRDWFHDTVLFGRPRDTKQVMREVDQLVMDLTV